jgi:ribonuclease BN (tRNA processing enzyme)
MIKREYPLHWKKKNFSIKIFCSIPNIATGILLKAGKTHFVIDPGDGILRDLNKEIGVKNLLDISDVFVTHGHHDHIGGVWSLLTYLRVMQKKTPLTIHYPEGCVEIESIYHAFAKVYSHTLSYKINLKSIKKTSSFATNQVTVKPFPVIHKENLSSGKTRQVPALGYNFSFDGMKICYGGDTAYCEELVIHAKNADLAILEAGHDEDTPDEMHMTMKEAVSIGQSAKKYFLVHVPE